MYFTRIGGDGWDAGDRFYVLIKARIARDLWELMRVVRYVYVLTCPARQLTTFLFMSLRGGVWILAVSWFSFFSIDISFFLSFFFLWRLGKFDSVGETSPSAAGRDECQMGEAITGWFISRSNVPRRPALYVLRPYISLLPLVLKRTKREPSKKMLAENISTSLHIMGGMPRSHARGHQR